MTQGRVINALILRETKSRYGDHKIGFLWALLEPIVMVTLFVGIMAAFRGASPGGGMPLVPFMICGMVPFTMFRNPMGQMQGSIDQNRSLLAFPQVTTFDVIVARSILEFIVLLAVFAVMLMGADLLGYSFRIENPLGVFAVCGLLSMLGTGMGFFFASLTPILPSTRQISGALLGRPLFLSSGLFFTADAIPMPVREWLLYNPILHMMELIRTEFFYEFESPHGSWQYAITWSVCAFAFGLIAHQALKRRAIIGL